MRPRNHLQGPFAIHEPAAGKAIFTGLVTSHALSRLDLIRHGPGIFQKLIPKAYEVRLTVVADKLFAVKILSQEKEQTRVDWRRAPYDLQHEPVELPEDIRYLVAAYMTEFDLVYSCSTLSDPGGQVVFLESDPGGQYLWIEYLTGLPITEAIVDALVWADPRSNAPNANQGRDSSARLQS